MTAARPSPPIDGALIERLWASYARLRPAATVGELFARAADIACSELGFTRGLVLGVHGTVLTAGESDPLTDSESDSLRRRVLASSIDTAPGSVEARLLRQGDRLRLDADDLPSSVATALGLGPHAVGGVVSEGELLALVVVDRPRPAITRAAQVGVAGFGAMLGLALERTITRARLQELSSELRQLSSSTQAMLTEVLEAPPSLPAVQRHGAAFPLLESYAPRAGDAFRGVLTERELAVARLLAAGLSNREIADRLILGQETVKAHVSRILRKLDASNRVEAATRFDRMSRGG